ncbi:hypothetical protein LAU_0126 [Lausannevirus]|uniref:Uncharacterized protein n=2 Tax=Lausannevirus TaxID=999883 RepID=A0A0N9PLX8_9VIRU|nr:hypothetical protein LAU_0126 [Lausannevirus]AEA06977.1 hypothetical protein LAU_0126 [Lausannevirus]ALH06809.1 hypothetical protein PMV_111 [Port-miou virus]
MSALQKQILAEGRGLKIFEFGTLRRVLFLEGREVAKSNLSFCAIIPSSERLTSRVSMRVEGCEFNSVFPEEEHRKILMPGNILYFDNGFTYTE